MDRIPGRIEPSEETDPAGNVTEQRRRLYDRASSIAHLNGLCTMELIIVEGDMTKFRLDIQDLLSRIKISLAGQFQCLLFTVKQTPVQ